MAERVSFLPIRLGLAVLVAGVIAATSLGTAQAQNRNEAAGRVGNGEVIRIFEKGSFSRCSAVFYDGERAMLRIAFNADRAYGLSIPEIQVQPRLPLTISVSSPGSGVYTADADGNQGGRAWRPLDTQTVARMMGFRGPLIVHAGHKRFQWNLGASMENVFVAIESCTNRATGWR